ncbi:MAG: pyruvate carboxylase subunit B, partial [Thermodesulfovibrionales bacterium]|nr:pyruvate carboxylase subunit B [Thermodesulfovibrionales bacterium]
AISSMAGGTSQPALETLCNILKGTPHDPFFSFKALGEIADYFKNIRKKYQAYESIYTSIDPDAIIYQLPGGMIAHLVTQLKEQNALNRIEEVLNEVPKVRRDFGYPPLVTPISQIVGTQATLNVLGGERYKLITIETKNYLKGLYGKPPANIDEDVRKKILENEEIITVRPADILSPELEKAKSELGDKANSEEDLLSYTLFPKIFLNYLELKEKGLYPLEEIPKDTIERDFAAIHPTKVEFTPHLAPTEFLINVHGESYNVKVSGIGHMTEGKKPYYLYIDDHLVEVIVEPLVEVLPSESGQIDSKATRQSIRPKALTINDVTTTMPGRIAKILVKKGDIVKSGDALLILEAMKMENEILSPIDGRVDEIFVSVGDSVNPDEVLMRIV